ncbi:hypothetical protein SAMN05443428_10294 [Caloramator quimbayensis]|uniref:Uncharacterized protein n=1 Tax=Caloramator quimbayensis TaxID=1147123 RepID=A0A1T4WMM3_9CLOT|nr:hypothetical protein [Caloramator quimbayensis]SKA78125.1 hypothetical protein SAMN05443428_10294 [Caloramator quimbayensis]
MENAYVKEYYGHYFNEVYIGGRWIRVNYDRIAQNILDSVYGGLMIKPGTETDHFTHEGFQKRYGLSRENLKKEKSLYVSESAAAYYSKDIKEENGKYSKIKIENTATKKLLNDKPIILGYKEPVELFDSIFTEDISNKIFSSFSKISKMDLYNSSNIILLKSDDKNNYIPDYLCELVPEINDNTANIIISKFENNKRIIIIKCKTEDLLLKTIKNLPEDIFTKDYSINLGN